LTLSQSSEQNKNNRRPNRKSAKPGKRPSVRAANAHYAEIFSLEQRGSGDNKVPANAAVFLASTGLGKAAPSLSAGEIRQHDGAGPMTEGLASQPCSVS
jgi:hypothetical protein